MKTVIRYVKDGTVCVQNGMYMLHPFGKKNAVKCCKHGTTETGEGATMIITDNTRGARGVYCLACLMEFLDREIGRIN